MANGVNLRLVGRSAHADLLPAARAGGISSSSGLARSRDTGAVPRSSSQIRHEALQVIHGAGRINSALLNFIRNRRIDKQPSLELESSQSRGEAVSNNMVGGAILTAGAVGASIGGSGKPSHWTDGDRDLIHMMMARYARKMCLENVKFGAGYIGCGMISALSFALTFAYQSPAWLLIQIPAVIEFVRIVSGFEEYLKTFDFRMAELRGELDVINKIKR